MSDEQCWCRKPLTLEINTAEIAEAERFLQEMKNHHCGEVEQEARDQT